MTSRVEALIQHEEPWVVTMPGFGGDNSGNPPVATDEVPERDGSRGLREFTALWSFNRIEDDPIDARTGRLYEALSHAQLSPIAPQYLEELAREVWNQNRIPEDELPLVLRHRRGLEAVFIAMEPNPLLERAILEHARRDPLRLFAGLEIEDIFSSWETYIRGSTLQ